MGHSQSTPQDSRRARRSFRPRPASLFNPSTSRRESLAPNRDVDPSPEPPWAPGNANPSSSSGSGGQPSSTIAESNGTATPRPLRTSRSMSKVSPLRRLSRAFGTSSADEEPDIPSHGLPRTDTFGLAPSPIPRRRQTRFGSFLESARHSIHGTPRNNGRGKERATVVSDEEAGAGAVAREERLSAPPTASGSGQTRRDFPSFPDITPSDTDSETDIPIESMNNLNTPNGEQLPSSFTSPSPPQSFSQQPEFDSRSTTPRPTNNPTTSHPESHPPVTPDNASPISAPAPASTNAETQTGLPRQLPPGGTIMIVQGVVHTTDPVRRQPSPTPPSTSASRQSRSRVLSSLMPGRSSSPRRATRTTSMPTGVAPHPTSGESALNQENEWSTSQDANPDDSSTTTPNVTNPSAPPALTPEEIQEFTQSSIDVLGALLSVATAATAASLVTGSVDPLFTAGFAGAGSVGADAERARTSRTFWDSLRERIRNAGRRDGARPDPAVEATQSMIQEMTRALMANRPPGFENMTTVPASPSAVDAAAAAAASASEAAASPNPTTSNPIIGESGPSPEATTTSPITPAPTPVSMPTPVPSSTPSPSGQHTLPRPIAAATQPTGFSPSPETFERFMSNLQTDLRTVLTQDYARRGYGTPSAPLPPRPPTPNPPRVPEPLDEDDHGTEEDEDVRPDDSESVQQEFPPGMSWWRMYRFPAMHLQTSAPATMPQPNLASSLYPQTSTAHPTTDSASIMQNAPATVDVRNLPVIVPIIVVGIRAVPTAQIERWTRGRRETVPEPPPQADPLTEPGFSDPVPSSSADDGTAPVAETSEAGRRHWSRAARALRLGRRAGERSSTGEALPPAPTVGPNRQSYIIWVVGGHYPLSHPLVTGQESDFDFEALWDIADLMVPPKPVVASPEDIAKSGLEIIKQKDIAEYERQGKISSNTTERCLICLDDYDDHNLRLLSCRHLFHQNCVDKWMQEGRNNCPACRSKGVRTSHDEPSISTNDTVS